MRAVVESLIAPEDQKTFSQPEIASQLLLSYADVLAQGLEQFVSEIAIINSPWGFEPQHITAETLIWHGTNDINIPVECSEYLAAQISSARLTIVEGAGHYFSLAQWPRLLQAVVAS